MRALRLLLLALIWASPGHATVLVRFETTLGDFDVELWDDVTPLTVANFLAYVRDGDYDGSFPTCRCGTTRAAGYWSRTSSS